jgi:hypothetical protein
MTRRLFQVIVVLGLLWGFGSSARSASTAPHSMDPGCSWSPYYCSQIGSECPNAGGSCQLDPNNPDNCICQCPDGNACY